jgi:decaprenylphospho-beta-D-erythro-pentofuranosid-2-ulose 2-reductase
MTASPKRILVLGALSAMAEATARLHAEEGAALVLAGRDAERLEALAQDLSVRGASAVHTHAIDLAEETEIERSFARMAADLGGIDEVLLFYGVLGDQRLAERDFAEAARIMRTNYVSASLWCLAAANLLERQRHGVLVVVGSVAGDRGRQSNYLYGSAKAGLAALVQGLAHRLHASGAKAVLVKPGFVISPMTAGFKRSGPLWASPQRIAAIVREAARGAAPVVYAPWFWRWIMAAIRAAPAPVLHRTKL